MLKPYISSNFAYNTSRSHLFLSFLKKITWNCFTPSEKLSVALLDKWSFCHQNPLSSNPFFNQFNQQHLFLFKILNFILQGFVMTICLAPGHRRAQCEFFLQDPVCFQHLFLAEISSDGHDFGFQFGSHLSYCRLCGFGFITCYYQLFIILRI